MYIHDEYHDEHGVLIWAKANTDSGWTPDVTSIQLDGYSSTNPVKKSNTIKEQFGKRTKGYGAPRVFDSNRPTGRGGPHKWHQPLCIEGQGDSDLGSPNENCEVKGPGVGAGNHKGDWWNCPPPGTIGNILIIQEANTYEDWEYCPDDAGSDGGLIEFHFDNPADIERVEMLDTDESKTPDIHFEKPGGETHTMPTPATGDNGLFQKDLRGDKYSGVTKVKFDYSGSGSVAGKPKYQSFAAAAKSVSHQISHPSFPSTIERSGVLSLHCSILFSHRITD